MSVDYNYCDSCKESVYEEYAWHCSECGHELCSWCLINKNDISSNYAHDYGVKCDGTQEQAEKYGFDLKDYKIGEVIDDVGIDSKHCPFCSGDKVHDKDLLKYLLAKYNITKDNLIDEYRKSRQ